MNKDFALDERLAADCEVLGRLPTSYVLLMNNRHYPWIILVPETACTEWYELPEAQGLALHQEAMQVSRFLKQAFPVTKINVAAIGNVVSQLHVHIVGRHAQDASWPGVVWGAAGGEKYTPEQVGAIKTQFERYIENSPAAGLE